MEYKEIFDTLKSLTKNYCLVKGCGKIIKTDAGFVLKDFTDESYVSIAGLFAEDLIKQAFTEEFECDVEKEGVYEFTALLNYSAAQIGDYPPPNIECQEYMTVDYIEYKFICSHEEAKQQQKELNSSTNAQFSIVARLPHYWQYIVGSS